MSGPAGRRIELETVQADFCVAGAGLAGLCAAVQAARRGLTVSLVGDRPVPGGNSSSELRMWTRGATGAGNLYAEEMGILGELKLENLYRNPEGNVVLWDEVLFDALARENNIRLYLNTHVLSVDAAARNGATRITALEAAQLASERRIRFESPLFLDATGDGTLGFLAGAEFRSGREARAEFGEGLAPPRADRLTLGSSIFFQSKRTDRPVRFIKPEHAYDIEFMAGLLGRGGRIVTENSSGTDLWWLEYGGLRDTIHDSQEISLELRKLAYGIWNYIKNSGRFAADNLTLEWVGLYPSKRESRRLVGDYLLNQNDLQQGRSFDDAVCHGGWYLDDHPPEGIYSRDPFCIQIEVPVYGIPLRCLYSRNVANLLLAGRDISATHAAFASSRIMNTCALTGQAAGMLAAVCRASGLDPRGVQQTRREEVRQQLLKEDVFIPGCRNQDPADLARSAKLTVSSVRPAALEQSAGQARLERDCRLLFPLPRDEAGIEILLQADAAAELVVESWSCLQAAGFRQDGLLSSDRLSLQPGAARWVALPRTRPAADCPGSILYVLRADPAVSLQLAGDSFTGLLGRWAAGPERFTPCFRYTGAPGAAQELWGPSALANGLSRPHGRPNLWMSAAIQEGGDGEWVELAWPEAVSIEEIRLSFNPDLARELVNLRSEKPAGHHGYLARSGMPPELVRDFMIEIADQAGWRSLAVVEGNRKRLAVVRLAPPVTTDRVRVRIDATWGGRHAELFELRAYGPQQA